MNEIAFLEAEKLLKELASLRLRARETAQVLRREEAPEEIALAVEHAARELRTASSAVSQLVYPAFAESMGAGTVDAVPSTLV